MEIPENMVFDQIKSRVKNFKEVQDFVRKYHITFVEWDSVDSLDKKDLQMFVKDHTGKDAVHESIWETWQGWGDYFVFLDQAINTTMAKETPTKKTKQEKPQPTQHATLTLSDGIIRRGGELRKVYNSARRTRGVKFFYAVTFKDGGSLLLTEHEFGRGLERASANPEDCPAWEGPPPPPYKGFWKRLLSWDWA